VPLVRSSWAQQTLNLPNQNGPADPEEKIDVANPRIRRLKLPWRNPGTFREKGVSRDCLGKFVSEEFFEVAPTFTEIATAFS
jgi:hypothetical protein